jgi:ABC-type uncharacterized transport system involved in gliding motility auxiliary subunit
MKLKLDLKTKPSLKGIKLILPLIKKDLYSYFNSPLAYIILALFITVTGIILFAVQKFTLLGSSDLTPLFTSISFAFIIIIPALMMGAVSKERQTGTIEFILTQPISEAYFLLAKFLVNAFMLVLMILLTLPISIIVSNYGSVDLGQLIMQYIGALILGLCFIVISLSVSSIFKNEITTLIVSIVISALFVVSGTEIAKVLPLRFDSIVYNVSLYSHYYYFSKGVLDIRDVLYFSSFLSAFFIISYYFLIKNKYPWKHPDLRKTSLITIISLVVVLFVGISGQYIPGRIDFTKNNVYTLSSETKNILKNIEDPVSVILYSSDNLPIQFQSQLRQVKDLMKDYDLTGGSKIDVAFKNPDSDKAIQSEASAAGIQPLVFSVNSDNSAQQTVGYFGIAIKHKEETEILAFVEEDTNVELELTQKIKKLTATDKLTIGIVGNNVAKTRFYDFQYFNQMLNEVYEIKDVTLDEENTSIPEDIDMLFLPGPNAALEDSIVNNIKKYVENGGSILFLVDPVTTDLTTETPAANENSLANLFEDYGIKVNTDLVYDRRNNNLVNVGSNVYQVASKYPLWVISKSTKEDIPLLKGIESVSLLWASSIDLVQKDESNIKIYELLETSKSSNVQKVEGFNIDPKQEFISKKDDSSKLMAVAFENEKSGRGVVVGTSGFIGDSLNQVVMDQNASFALGAVEWLIKDEGLTAIRNKDRSASKLNLTEGQKTVLIASGTVGPVGFILMIAVVKLVLRQLEIRKRYVS